MNETPGAPLQGGPFWVVTVSLQKREVAKRIVLQRHPAAANAGLAGLGSRFADRTHSRPKAPRWTLFLPMHPPIPLFFVGEADSEALIPL